MVSNFPHPILIPKGADADFVLLDDDLHVLATYVNGELAWEKQ